MLGAQLAQLAQLARWWELLREVQWVMLVRWMGGLRLGLPIRQWPPVLRMMIRLVLRLQTWQRVWLWGWATWGGREFRLGRRG